MNRSAESRLGFRISTVGGLRKELRVNQRLTAFVVGSQYMADHVAAHGFDRRRLHVLPLYSMPPADGAAVAREPDLLLFAGQLVRGKGLDVLLRALALTRHPVRLAVVGTGRQEQMYRALSHSLGLNGKVTFQGKVSSEEMPSYYRRAACLVLPSRSPETFGLVGPEAMSYGTPVIASRVGGIGEWLEDGRTGLAAPGNDPAALAQAIDRIVGDLAFAAALSEAARRRYDERFRPERHLDALVGIYDVLVQ